MEVVFFEVVVLADAFRAEAFFPVVVFADLVFRAGASFAGALPADAFFVTALSAATVLFAATVFFTAALPVPATAFFATAFFFPFVSLAAASAAVDLADADFSAVFFATMAAAPSHTVISLANRAGTINRPQPRGKRGTPPIRPASAGARRTCIRCAQLPAR